MLGLLLSLNDRFSELSISAVFGSSIVNLFMLSEDMTEVPGVVAETSLVLFDSPSSCEL